MKYRKLMYVGETLHLNINNETPSLKCGDIVVEHFIISSGAVYVRAENGVIFVVERSTLITPSTALLQLYL